jgi:serine/threonine protein kinase
MATQEDRLIDLLERWDEGERRGQPARVEELCADCPELAGDLARQIAVKRRLDRLAGPDDTAADTCAPGEPSPSTAAVAGKSTHDARPWGLPAVPGYEGIEYLGGGGMATVYRARHVRLGRQVALKLVRIEQLTSLMLARLQAEARAVAQLDHPHIVKVHEVGECRPADGGGAVPYIALEYVPGGSLQKRLSEQLPSPGESARLVMLLARAMQHAHERGIVHRDLKPDNVLLAEPADEPALNTALGCPKVTDFGLARQQASPGPEPGQDRLTQTGAVMGTPAYMAPEQADGRSDVGPAADVYALGAILYRLLTGRVPFKADSTIDVLYQVRHQAPPSIRQLRAEVPAGLEAICLRCLAKNPADRYPSAAALAADLKRWQEEPGGEGPTTSLPPIVPVRGRRRLLVAVSLLGLLLGGGLLGWRGLSSANNRAGEGPAASEPFKGSIDIVMSRPGDPHRQGVRLDDSAARPLRAGDQVQIEVKLNRPAYLYVLWIDTEGAIGPVHPWIEGDWKQRRQEKPVRELLLPNRHSGAPPPGGWKGPPTYRVEAGPAGMETLLLLVRTTPLPQDVDLKTALAGLGAQKRSNKDELSEVAWFEDGRLVRDEQGRGADLKVTVEGQNAVLRLHHTLRQRLGNQFEYTRAVTFGNQGGK